MPEGDALGRTEEIRQDRDVDGLWVIRTAMRWSARSQHTIADLGHLQFRIHDRGRDALADHPGPPVAR